MTSMISILLFAKPILPKRRIKQQPGMPSKFSGKPRTEDGMKLTDAQNEKLEWLHTQGGSGYLDKHGRMVAGGDHMPQGCWPVWLNLVAHGLIAGGDGRLTITDYGRRHMAPSGATE